MKYDENPQRILFENRARVPTLEQLTAQVVSLARSILDIKEYVARLEQLEDQILDLQLIPVLDSPARSLNSDFVISTTKNIEAKYTIELGVIASLLGSHINSATVDLLINGIPAHTVKNSLDATITLGLSLTPVVTQVLSAIVPVGATVNLATTLVGNASATIVAVQELVV